MIEVLSKKYKKVYIYGAGKTAQLFSDFLSIKGVDFEGYIISDMIKCFEEGLCNGKEKLFKAFNENKYFQELCKNNDVWVYIKPKNTEIIRSGLEVDIFASKLNEPKLESREYVIGYNTSKFYENNDIRINDYSELKKQGYQSQLNTLISDYNSHTEDIIESFVKNVEGLKSGVKKFFERGK